MISQTKKMWNIFTFRKIQRPYYIPKTTPRAWKSLTHAVSWLSVCFLLSKMGYYNVSEKKCQERFPAIFVLPSRIAAAEKWRVGFYSENVVGQRSKTSTMTCEHQVKAHAIFDKIKCVWRAHRTREYMFLLKSTFLCWKTLDKTACLWYYIFCKWAWFNTQHFSFRGIAQLVEQRSPNVNAATIIRINTELSRLGTSVSSLFPFARR